MMKLYLAWVVVLFISLPYHGGELSMNSIRWSWFCFICGVSVVSGYVLSYALSEDLMVVVSGVIHFFVRKWSPSILEEVGGDFLASRIGGLNFPISISIWLNFSCKRSLSSCHREGGDTMDQRWFHGSHKWVKYYKWCNLWLSWYLFEIYPRG